MNIFSLPIQYNTIKVSHHHHTSIIELMDRDKKIFIIW